MPTCWFTLCRSQSSPLFPLSPHFFRLFLRIDGSRILIKDTRIFHNFSSDKVFVEISTRQVTPPPPLVPLTTELRLQGQESDYQIPVSAVTPSSSLQIPGISTPLSRPNPVSPTSPSATASPAFRPLSLTGVQLRDSNFMSRILPLQPFKVTAPAAGGDDQTAAESVETKPQLDFYLQLTGN
jgi:hypothetical protein